MGRALCDLLRFAQSQGIEQAWALTMAPLLKEMTPEERSALVGVEDDSYEGGMAIGPETLPRGIPKAPWL